MKTSTFKILRVAGNIFLISALILLILLISVSCAYQPQPESGAVKYEPISTYNTWR